ncbi:30S ribosomal protein S20 [Elusimicrobiota bacterium]
MKIKKTGRHTGALKAQRQSLRHRSKNIIKKEKIKELVKGITAAISSKDSAKAEELLKKSYSAIDKAVKRNIFHWRKGAKKKAQLTGLINSIKTASAKTTQESLPKAE